MRWYLYIFMGILYALPLKSQEKGWQVEKYRLTDSMQTGLCSGLSPDGARQANMPLVRERADAPRQVYIKTNLIAWGMLMLNAAVEIDLSPRLSFHVPLYYSGWNYFSRMIKFRGFALQPELRLWLQGKRRCFVGAHAGMAYYNLAWGGKWRIQDRDGNTPAWGGGISAGYRMPFCRNGRFCMEFSLGSGVYKVSYDKFANERQGAYHSTVRKTFIGLDQLGVSVSYCLNRQ